MNDEIEWPDSFENLGSGGFIANNSGTLAPYIPIPLIAMGEIEGLLRQTSALETHEAWKRSTLVIAPGLVDGLRAVVNDPQCPRISQPMTGIQVLESPYVPKTVWRQYRFPRSKKVRIRKKWAKDKRNWREAGVAYWIDMKSFRIDSSTGIRRRFPETIRVPSNPRRP